MNIKIPVSWLRDYLKTDLAAKTIANYLSLSGPSVEKIIKDGQDLILDVEVTSNRIDALSVFGLAREAHTIFSLQNQKSQLAKPRGLDLMLEPDVGPPLKLEVIIKNKTLCPRFTAIVVNNVKVKPSPAIIRKRLEMAGIRAINNIVDISNYIMLELGQPMHAFDFDKIRDARMILRRSLEGEKITTLDGQTRKLPEGAIVVEDNKRLIDLCGIMGGANTQITRRTKRVVFFVQAYDPTTIRKTTQALAFRTEAASRFEKGIDVENIVPALARAVYLAKKTAGAKIASELIDIKNRKIVPKPLSLNLSKVNLYLGMKLEPSLCLKILNSLGFQTKLEGQKIIAQAPSWRLGDIEIDVDLIEEIARIYGYRNLPSRLPQGQIPKRQAGDLEKVLSLKNALGYLGLTEVITYSIIPREFLPLSGLKEENCVELANPLTDLWQFMRPTILISLAQVIAKNQNIKNDIKIFEIAKTYLKRENDLPKQDLMLAVVFENGDFYKIKGLVENVMQILKREVKWGKFSGKNTIFEARESADLTVDGQHVGSIGILRSQITDYFQIEGKVAAAELNLSKIYTLPSKIQTYKPIPKYPPVIEDISAIFDLEVPLDKITSTVKKAGLGLVKEVEAIDVFQDEKIGRNKKSVTLRLTYQRTDQTPKQEEVTETREKIIDFLAKSFGAVIRR